MIPIKKGHTNDILKAPRGLEDRVMDLPITRFANNGGIASVWKVERFWDRFKLFFTGQVTFHCSNPTHPPIKIWAGDAVKMEVENEF